MGKVWSFQKGAMWALDLKAGYPAPIPSPSTPARFEEAGRSSMEELRQAMGLDSPDLILQRFERGNRCFAFWIDNRIASYCWVSRGAEWIGEMQVYFRMTPGEAYIWDCLTLPDFRRQGLYSALLGRMLAQLKQEGLQRAWIGSNLENRASIKGFENAGFRPVVQIWFFRLLSLLFFWIRPYPPASRELVAAVHRAYAGERALRIGPLIIRRPADQKNGPAPAYPPEPV